MSEFIEVLNTAAANSPETLAAGGGTYALARILGPSVKAMGSALGDFTDYRLRNLLGLESKVARRMKDETEGSDEQTVHPRVAKQLLDEGSWIDDDLHQEYLAGLLVGSRSSDAKSDAAVYLSAIVTSLTADQVRLHYATMSAYAGLWDGTSDVSLSFPLARKDQYRTKSVIVPNYEVEQLCENFSLAAKGLVREGILSDYGRPIVGTEMETHQVLIPAPLAFDIYLASLGTRPMTAQAMLLDREMIPGYFVEPDGAVKFAAARIDNPGG